MRKRRPGYLRANYRDERGRDRECEITVILADELIRFGLARLKSNSSRELRLNPEYLLTKSDGHWVPQARTESLSRPHRPSEWQFRLRTNAEILLRRALYSYSPEDAQDFRWVLALAAK